MIRNYFKIFENNLYKDITLVSVLTIIGALLRLLYLEQYPPGMAGDESLAGLEAQRILRDGYIGPWSGVALGGPSGMYYLVALFFYFLPDNIFTLRLAHAVVGIITLPVFYLFLRYFFDRKCALTGLFLLCFSTWHIYYSRTALPYVGPPFFISLSLFLLGIGLKKENIKATLLSGAVLGFGVYTYLGYFAVLWIFMLFWLVIVFSYRKRIKYILTHASLFSVAALITSLALILYFIEHPESLKIRIQLSSVFKHQPYIDMTDLGDKIVFILNRIYLSLNVFFGLKKESSINILGFLNPAVHLFLIIGVLVSLSRFRDWRYSVLLIGILIGLLQTAFTLPTGVYPGEMFKASTRGIIALPMVYALAAIGAIFVFNQLNKFASSQHQTYSKIAFAILIISIIIYINIPHYFRFSGNDLNKWVYTHQLKVATQYLKNLNEKENGVYVLFYSPRWSWNYEIIQFQAPELKGENRSREFGSLSFDKKKEQNRVVYLLMPPYNQHIKEVMDLYPSGKHEEIKEENNNLLFSVYYIKTDQ